MSYKVWQRSSMSSGHGLSSDAIVFAMSEAIIAVARKSVFFLTSGRAIIKSAAEPSESRSVLCALYPTSDFSKHAVSAVPRS